MPRIGAIGFHPAPVPLGRGRHPIIWALALGLEHTASTFFWMNNQADSGDIVSQYPVPIGQADDAAALYKRIMDTAERQLREFVPLLSAGIFPRTPQKTERVVTWRKRSKADGLLDFRVSAKSAYNLVRALAPPYPCAHLCYGAEEIHIHRASIVSYPCSGDEPGKVLRSDKNGILVKCGEDALLILEHTFSRLPQEGEYLL